MANIKTDISLRKSLLEEAEAVAREMKISKSRLFMMAVEDFIRRHRGKKLLEKIDAAYQDDESDRDEGLRLSRMRRHHRKLVEGEW
jgi:metal-responsive CopG/Arc/MetJ family transcriptional regulator